jgi:uncharacterized protein with ATP-grasp and redox domains
MKTFLDCIPCFLRQALDVARMVSPDLSFHERIVREVLPWIGGMDLDEPPPVVGQRIHRRLREITGVEDPYRSAKDQQNRMALVLLPEMKAQVEAASDPLALAAKLAIAANTIDLGAKTAVVELDVRSAMARASREPLLGDMEYFRNAVARARRILYLADNAGEIVFDRLLIERLSPARVTLAVRGAPVINDATMADARAAGLHEIVEIIDNGSDAPGTVLEDCSPDFTRRFAESDLIISKGQGNFETLSDDPRGIIFLFQAKCPVIAEYTGVPLRTNIIMESTRRLERHQINNPQKKEGKQ